mmetsp:Transcript_7366/g.7223  ORF Transcript_7366/g.7223 Transcript_7366/m.7223 type:complete len:142 (-) Transcript_7366:476-901(-)
MGSLLVGESESQSLVKSDARYISRTTDRYYRQVRKKERLFNKRRKLSSGGGVKSFVKVTSSTSSNGDGHGTGTVGDGEGSRDGGPTTNVTISTSTSTTTTTTPPAALVAHADNATRDSDTTLRTTTTTTKQEVIVLGRSGE